jgi:hypothetical protein
MSTAQRLRTDLFDCIQVNLAMLADRSGDPDRHLALGAVLRFEPWPGAAGLPTVEPPLAIQLPEAQALAGLKVVCREDNADPFALRELARRHETVYAIGDSYHMPWLPYYRRRHMEHSFLVACAPDDCAQISDAYDNQTAWGPAAPGTWRYGWGELPTASVAIVYETADSYSWPAPSVHIGEARDYIDAYARHPDRLAAMQQLAVETWLLSRARQLHARLRHHLGEPPNAATEAHLHRWEQIATTTFIALRRVQRGKPEPGTLLADLAQALDTDREVFSDKRNEETR